MGKIRPEERYVQTLFLESFALHLEKIAETSTKTPDFHIHGRQQEFIGALEVKLMTRVPLDEKCGWTREEGDMWYQKVDNGPSRVARDIAKAYPQLETTGGLKVLAFVNDTSMLDVKDLEEAFNGFHVYADEQKKVRFVNNVSRGVANGEIKEIKGKIDMYAWIDRWNDGEMYFRFTSQLGKTVFDTYMKEFFDRSAGNTT